MFRFEEVNGDLLGRFRSVCRSSFHFIEQRLPLQYRVLCGQFLLRIVDLESLAVEADVPRFLGQFAGVLLFLSLLHAAFAYVAIYASPWLVVQYLIRTMLLVAGLIVEANWESTFPDRIDITVLGALPLRPGVLPAAKVSATGALLGMALLALNAAPGLEIPMLLGPRYGGLRVLAAYWIAMSLATLFPYVAVLTLQGVLALTLPRRMFLRISAGLQILAFALLLLMYFLEPVLTTSEAMSAGVHRTMLEWSPQFWFFAVFDQILGHLPAGLHWIASLGWGASAVSVMGAICTIRWGYARVVARTLEEADLLPSRQARGGRTLPLPGVLRRAMVPFSAKVLARSRHHRVLCSFYAAVVLSIGLSSLGEARLAAFPHEVTIGFLMGSVAMMGIAITGLRSLFSLPLSLHANWVWRLTESDTPERYLAAARTVLFLFAAAPVWLFAAGLSCFYRPWKTAGQHQVVLLLLAAIFIEVNLLTFQKVPFACSYLPGKSNVQAVFWTAVLFLLPLTSLFALWESHLLGTFTQAAFLMGALFIIEIGLWVWNRSVGRPMELDFEDAEPNLVVTLGLGPV